MHNKRTFVRTEMRTDTSTQRMPNQKHYSLRRCQRIRQVPYFLIGFRSRLALVCELSKS